MSSINIQGDGGSVDLYYWVSAGPTSATLYVRASSDGYSTGVYNNYSYSYSTNFGQSGSYTFGSLSFPAGGSAEKSLFTVYGSWGYGQTVTIYYDGWGTSFSDSAYTGSAPAPTNYTVGYNKNTTDTVTNMPSSQTKTQNVTLTLASNVPSRIGFSFVEWNTNAAGTGASYQPGGAYTTNASVTLYAIWSEAGRIRKYIDGEWKSCLPYKYISGEWKLCIPYVYKDGEWKKGV